MSDSSNLEGEGQRSEVDISRRRLQWGNPWLWVVILLLLSVVFYVTFPPAPVPNQPPPQDPWWDIVFANVCFVLVGLCAWLILWHKNRWVWVSQRPAKKLARGNAVAAEHAYEKALTFARTFPLNDFRRGTMLLNLAIFLVNRARRDEARTLFGESVAILEKNSSKNPLNYLTLLNNLAVFLIDGKEYEAAQHTLEKAIDLSPTIKKTNIQCPELELVLRLSLIFLFIRMDLLANAKHYLKEAEELFDAMSWGSRRACRDAILAQRCLFSCAVGEYDAVQKNIAQASGSEDTILLWAQAKVHLNRREFAQAEQVLRKAVRAWEKLGTPHRPENLEITLDLGESLFHEAKHDDAFASLQEARSIVADFALPSDDAWRKALVTWQQRATELGRTELAASLDQELAHAAVTPNPAITILEKFRVHKQPVE